MARLAAAALALGAARAAATVSYGVAVVNETAPDGFTLQMSDSPLPIDGSAVAWATFNNSLNATGWSTLEVHTSAAYADDLAIYAAGFVEGALTAAASYDFLLNNFIDAGQLYPEDLATFLESNRAYVAQQAESSPLDPFWYHSGLVARQQDGLYAGYLAAADPSNRPISYNDYFGASLVGDLFDLDVVYPDAMPGAGAGARAGGNATRGGRLLSRRKRGLTHCSAAVKAVWDAETSAPTDVIVGHDTWAAFESMARIWKLYDFPLSMPGQGGRVPAVRSSFSSYPATIYSSDDIYALSSGLVVLETTINNNNDSLWSNVVPTSVLTWARSTVANRISSTAVEWTTNFARENSGTYNNQWMALDFAHWTPGTPFPAGFFMVLEQMPGYVHTEDKTATLQGAGFWPSYNVPAFPFIFNISGQQELVDAYGPYFSFANTSRAIIFQRLASGITDVSGMMSVLRYNEYETDPISTQGCKHGWRSATNAISDRSDLTSDKADCIADLQPGDGAGIDGKVTSYSMLQSGALTFLAQSGPTFVSQPPFAFSNTTLGDIPHRGMPDLWTFPWVTIEWPQAP